MARDRTEAAQGANDTTGGEYGKASQNQRFSAKAIGERADYKLPESESNEEATQQETKFRRGNRKLGANPRKGRKDDVGGKCAERGQPGEQEEDCPRQPALGRRGARDRKRGHHGFLLTTGHVDVP